MVGWKISGIRKNISVMGEGTVIKKLYPTRNYIFKVNNRNTRTRMFKVNNKDTKMAPLTSLSLFLTLNIFHNLF